MRERERERDARARQRRKGETAGWAHRAERKGPPRDKATWGRVNNGVGVRERSPHPERTNNKRNTKTQSLKSPFPRCLRVCFFCVAPRACVGVCQSYSERTRVRLQSEMGGEGHTSRVAVAWPLATSPGRAVLSPDPVASVLPSGVKATLATAPAWPWCVVEGKRERERRAREATAQG